MADTIEVDCQDGFARETIEHSEGITIAAFCTPSEELVACASTAKRPIVPVFNCKFTVATAGESGAIPLKLPVRRFVPVTT